MFNFFFIYKFEQVVLRKINAVVYSLILVSFIVGGGAAWISQGSSKCSGTGYGGMVMFMATVEVASGAILLVGNAVLVARFQRGSPLPQVLTGK